MKLSRRCDAGTSKGMCWHQNPKAPLLHALTQMAVTKVVQPCHITSLLACLLNELLLQHVVLMDQ